MQDTEGSTVGMIAGYIRQHSEGLMGPVSVLRGDDDDDDDNNNGNTKQREESNGQTNLSTLVEEQQPARDYHSARVSSSPSMMDQSDNVRSVSEPGMFQHTALLAFGSVAEGRRHVKREDSKRRFLKAVQAVRNINRLSMIRGSVSVPAGEESPLIDDNNNNNNNNDNGLADGEEIKPTTWQVLWDMVFGRYVSLFLVCLPFACLANFLQWGPLWIFWLNFFTMVPLASILGDFTQEVALHTNQVVGGLINATFGNTVEVIVGIQALLANQYRVVQASMLGSIFSNLLLVLGSCFFFGGLRRSGLVFNRTAATANMSLLALSSIALVLPTPFAEYYAIEDARVLEISRATAIFLMVMYIQLLVFQLKTHSDLFEEEDDEEAELSMLVAMVGLVVTTGLIAFFSEYLVGSINGFVAASGVSQTFIGIIILPIVGNAVEHVTAVTVAWKNKMDLAMAVAVGSCTQISLFVVPLVIIIGWIFDKDMTLNFPHFEIILYVLSILTVSICLSNNSGNWLEGSLLITTYVMIAIGFWYETVISYGSTETVGNASILD